MKSHELSELFRLRREGHSYRHISEMTGVSRQRLSRICRRIVIPGASREYVAAVRNGQLDIEDLLARRGG